MYKSTIAPMIAVTRDPMNPVLDSPTMPNMGRVGELLKNANNRLY